MPPKPPPPQSPYYEGPDAPDTPDTTPTGTTDWSAYTPTALRFAWRAGNLSEAEWVATLVAAGKSPEAAKFEVEKAKSTGVSTSKATLGQLTAAEQAGVDAFKSSWVDKPKPTPDDLKKFLGAFGINVPEERLQQMVDEQSTEADKVAREGKPATPAPTAAEKPKPTPMEAAQSKQQLAQQMQQQAESQYVMDHPELGLQRNPQTGQLESKASVGQGKFQYSAVTPHQYDPKTGQVLPQETVGWENSIQGGSMNPEGAYWNEGRPASEVENLRRMNAADLKAALNRDLTASDLSPPGGTFLLGGGDPMYYQSRAALAKTGFIPFEDNDQYGRNKVVNPFNPATGTGVPGSPDAGNTPAANQSVSMFPNAPMMSQSQWQDYNNFGDFEGSKTGFKFSDFLRRNDQTDEQYQAEGDVNIAGRHSQFDPDWGNDPEEKRGALARHQQFDPDSLNMEGPGGFWHQYQQYLAAMPEHLLPKYANPQWHEPGWFDRYAPANQPQWQAAGDVNMAGMDPAEIERQRLRDEQDRLNPALDRERMLNQQDKATWIQNQTYGTDPVPWDARQRLMQAMANRQAGGQTFDFDQVLQGLGDPRAWASQLDMPRIQENSYDEEALSRGKGFFPHYRGTGGGPGLRQWSGTFFAEGGEALAGANKYRVAAPAGWGAPGQTGQAPVNSNGGLMGVPIPGKAIVGQNGLLGLPWGHTGDIGPMGAAGWRSNLFYPGLQYLPPRDPDTFKGVPVFNTSAYGHWGRLPGRATGGVDGAGVTTGGPMGLVDMQTGQTKAITGEAGPEAVISVPLTRPAEGGLPAAVQQLMMQGGGATGNLSGSMPTMGSGGGMGAPSSSTVPPPPMPSPIDLLRQQAKLMRPRVPVALGG